MQVFSEILVPTDFSESAAHALRHAIRLARATGARITLLHAGVIPGTAAYDIGGYGAPYPETLAALQKQMAAEQKHALEKLAKEEIPEDVTYRTVLREEWTPDAVLAEAKACKADLVCMGSHGRTGIGRVLLGSVTERVISKAEIPVMVCR
jgi:nucleotide-binding universal stress UspA family protein